MFVEYKNIREVFAYANLSIEFWSRNTATSNVFKIYEMEKNYLNDNNRSLANFDCQRLYMFDIPLY